MANMNEVMNTYTYPEWMNVNKNENGNQGEGKLGKKGKGIGSVDNNIEQNNTNNDNNKTGGPPLPKHDYKVKMCCFKCEEKVLEESHYLFGVQSMNIDRGLSKVSVVGKFDPTTLLKKFKKNVDKKACFWAQEAKEESGGGFRGGQKYGQKHRTEGDCINNNSNNYNNGGGEKKKGEARGGSGSSSDQQNTGEGQSCNNAPKYNNDNNRLNGHGGGGGENAYKDKNKPNNANNNIQNQNQGSGDGEEKAKCKGGGSGAGGNNHRNNSQRMEQSQMVFQQQEWDSRGFPPLRGYGGGGYPDYHSHETHFQPKANYYSDYWPSQSYLADFLNMYYSNQPVPNPSYMKRIIY